MLTFCNLLITQKWTEITCDSCGLFPWNHTKTLLTLPWKTWASLNTRNGKSHGQDITECFLSIKHDSYERHPTKLFQPPWQQCILFCIYVKTEICSGSKLTKHDCNAHWSLGVYLPRNTFWEKSGECSQKDSKRFHLQLTCVWCCCSPKSLWFIVAN